MPAARASSRGTGSSRRTPCTRGKRRSRDYSTWYIFPRGTEQVATRAAGWPSPPKARLDGLGLMSRDSRTTAPAATRTHRGRRIALLVTIVALVALVALVAGAGGFEMEQWRAEAACGREDVAPEGASRPGRSAGRGHRPASRAHTGTARLCVRCGGEHPGLMRSLWSGPAGRVIRRRARIRTRY